MSLRADTSPLITGALVASAYAGHGILGSAVVTSGSQGYGSIISGSFPTFSSTKEYRLQIISLPANAVLNEDGSGSYTPPGGIGYLKLFEDGIEVP